MTSRRLSFALLALALAVSLPATAATYPVDDSASQVLGSSVRMRWDTLVPAPGQRSSMLSGSIAVLVRLNVSPWKGRQGRIYMTLPSQPSGPVTVSWTARGPLLPGVLRDGERTLVYAGPIQGDLIVDTQRLIIQADGQTLVRPGQLNVAFEIDLETP